MGFQEALSPDTQNASQGMLYLNIPPVKRFHKWSHQQASILLHLSRHVMEVLSAIFPGTWIGMGDSVPWPPRSTDLTLLDFFFWGYIRNYIYMGTIQDLYHGKARISEANEQVTIFL